MVGAVTRGRDRRGLISGSLAIAAAIGVMNISTYGFTILAARWLGPVHYGALAAMMGLLLVLNVASLGLQATAARRLSAAPETSSRLERDIMALSVRAALVLGVICLAASPVINIQLHLSDWLTAAMLAVAVVPLTIMGGQAGVLQGERRWAALAMIYLASGLGRLVCGVLALMWRADSLGAMVGVAVGAFVPAVVGWLALRHPTRQGAGPVADVAGTVPDLRGLVREIGHNSHALLAFFALSNVDVIVARTTLDEHQAGLYAGGLILAKAVLFLPQFVVVIAFPSMADGSRRNMHLRGLGLVLAIGACAVAGAAALSSVAVTFIGGREYASLGSSLWAFAGLGTVLAMLQLMVYDVVARQHQRAVALMWLALVAVLATIPFVNTELALLSVVSTVDVALLLGLLGVSLRRGSRTRVG